MRGNQTKNNEDKLRNKSKKTNTNKYNKTIPSTKIKVWPSSIWQNEVNKRNS